MKKAVIITAVLLLIAGAGGSLWLKTRLDTQAVAKVVQEQKQEQSKSKYDVGPPDAQEMLELVNEERAKVGAAPLKLDERLNASAQEKADDMQNRDYYGHVSPEGTRGTIFVFKHMPSKCRYAGELAQAAQGFFLRHTEEGRCRIYPRYPFYRTLYRYRENGFRSGYPREGFCTVAALQEECAAFSNLTECLAHGVDLTGEDERRYRDHDNVCHYR